MQAYIARQPIMDRKQKVVAYELLFRNGVENYFSEMDGSKASSQVMANSMLLFGAEKITSGKKAFINVTRELLIDAKFLSLPSSLFSLEVLEDVAIDQQLLEACRNLKENGYQLIIDDFAEKEGIEDLVKIADIVKIDVLSTEYAQQQQIIAKYRDYGPSFLAEKVETWKDLNQAHAMGYEYFQGYFFQKPVVMSHKAVPGYKHHYLELMQEILRPDINLQNIEDLIKQDVSLSYKLLRYINSAFFGLRVEVKSIKHALVVLGEEEIKKWTCLLLMGLIAEDKPPELMVTSMMRARLCELLAGQIGMSHKSQDLFLLGLFSMMDAIVGRPLEEIIGELPLSKEIKDTLSGKDSPLGGPLSLAIAYEAGDWQTFSEVSMEINCPGEDVSEQYMATISWVDERLSSVSAS